MKPSHILTDLQCRAITLVGEEKQLANLRLSGGTALAAFYLEHRLSDDIDFFSFEPIDTVFLHAFTQRLKNTLGAQDMRYERLYDRNLFFLSFEHDQELKMEFTHYPFSQLAPEKEEMGIRIDSFADIAAGKLMALLDRFDPKDFVDIFFILKQLSLSELRKNAEQKFGTKIGGIFLGRELIKVRRITALPSMIKKVEIPELVDFFEVLAREVGREVVE